MGYLPTNTYSYNPGTLVLTNETINGEALSRNYDALGRRGGFNLGADYVLDYAYDTYGDLSQTHTGVYAYVADSSLLASLTIGVSTSSYTYETNRNQKASPSHYHNGNLLSKYAYRHDVLGRRKDVVNTGSAFKKGQNHFTYNSRSELTLSRRYDGDDPTIQAKKRTTATGPTFTMILATGRK